MNEPTERELQEYADRLAGFRALGAPTALRRDLRGALLAAPVAPRAAPARGSWLLRLRPVFAILVVFAILAGGAGSAAAGSLPGDAAFGLKRAVEDVQVALAPDDAARLDLLVGQTESRLSDLETLASRRSTSVAAGTDEYLAALARLDQMLATVSAEPSTPSRDAALARAQSVAAAHVTRLEALAGSLPEAAQHGIERAIDAGKALGVPGASERPSRSPEPSRPGEVPGGAGGRTSAPPVRPTPPSGTPPRR